MCFAYVLRHLAAEISGIANPGAVSMGAGGELNGRMVGAVSSFDCTLIPLPS
jgi:hypothetical protein